MSGKLFVIEGLDGSGKQTQSDLLYRRLLAERYQIKKVEFPNYRSESSSLVKMYLRGDFGTDPNQISPYISSTFFAADRYASYKTEFEQFYLDGGIIIADRYTTSNMVHQASKIHEESEKTRFLDWLWSFEFEMYQIPVPNQVFFLDVRPVTAMQLIANRENKFSHEKEKDIHEKSRTHLSDSYVNALKLVKKYSWETIDCNTENGSIKSIEEINEMIYLRIKTYLEV